jgi:uncharacterized protein with HEPN domain
MQLQSRKYLEDVRQAVEAVRQFTAGKDFLQYQQDALLRSAVERQFEIIGEALRRISSIDPPTALQITDYQRIIAFRNILSHAYGRVDHRLVWALVEGKLHKLREEVEFLLTES